MELIHHMNLKDLDHSIIYIANVCSVGVVKSGIACPFMI